MVLWQSFIWCTQTAPPRGGTPPEGSGTAETQGTPPTSPDGI
ncbi:MAG TPA: hypothetical protein VMV49_15235 [Candidatus Deferrimicrobium sp.]|nr:hypothetical protein [Candidatus Deferrimicrobium sp.]